MGGPAGVRDGGWEVRACPEDLKTDIFFFNSSESGVLICLDSRELLSVTITTLPPSSNSRE